MATSYNPYDANRAMALPREQQVAAQRKADRQANRPSGPKARPSHLAAIAAAKKMPRVRVEPTRPELRDIIQHPNGMRFRKEGSVEWPLDRFTQRRLREGSIRIVETVNAQQKRTPSRGERETHK
jgi:hypothetical protein